MLNCFKIKTDSLAPIISTETVIVMNISCEFMKCGLDMGGRLSELWVAEEAEGAVVSWCLLVTCEIGRRVSVKGCYVNTGKR